MTDKELMQQALDALFTCQEDWIFDGEDERPTKTYDEKLVGAAFKALRARLAQQGEWQINEFGDSVLVAQPEQEPVAWMDEVGSLYHYKEYETDKPLYTAPPQREWQGLTLDEIFDVWRESYGKNGVATDVFARAIEAKLKEKNA